jgi:hypothetical protein
VLAVFVGAVGMVEQAGDEVGRPATDRDAIRLHQGQHRCGVEDVGEVDRRALEHGNEEGAEHPDEVPDRGRGQLTPTVGWVVGQQLTRLEPEGLMTVDDALGVSRRTRREGDQGRPGRIGGDGARHRLRLEQLVETVLVCPLRSTADEDDDRDVRAEVGLVGHPAEPFGGHEDARLGRRHDVRNFLAAVEVHDRHDHGS